MQHISAFRLTWTVFFRMLAASLISALISITVLVFLNQPFGRAICQLMNFSVTISLLYPKIWSVGYADRNRVQYAYSMENTKKGLFAGLFGLAPFCICGLLLFLSKIGLLPYNFLFLYRVSAMIIFPLNYSILPATMTLTELSLTGVLFSVVWPYLFFLPVTACAYALGYGDTPVLRVIQDWRAGRHAAISE